jgi:hypothetical protein
MLLLTILALGSAEEENGSVIFLWHFQNKKPVAS